VGNPRSAILSLGSFAMIAGAIAAGGCVDGFKGSNIQIDFSASVMAQANPETPPPDTYFTLYAVDQVVDETTHLVTAEYLFEIQRFKIQPAVDLASPCNIDIEGSPYPGLHVTQFANKEREQTGITDPFLPGLPENDVSRVLTADQRLVNAQALQEVKAVTSNSITEYPPVGSACVEEGGSMDQLPPTTCIGEASNAVRLAVCRTIWASDPLLFEGNDKSLTALKNGELYGFVQGQNPINGATLGGSQIFVDEVLDFDAYSINWQYNDRNGDGVPDYPPGTPDDEKPPAGYPFVAGYPQNRTRGVVNVPMINRNDPSVSANMAIFADLGDDPLTF
jgi:hypothetical protein